MTKQQDERAGERCRYSASVLPMKQCVLNEGHAGEHRAEKGPLNLQEVSAATTAAEDGEPIPMVLHCPRCGKQHVDTPESERAYQRRLSNAMPAELAPRWTNPPHKSHLCHSCRTVWRPADVATTGVASIQSRGKADTWAPAAAGESQLQCIHGLAVNEPCHRCTVDAEDTESLLAAPTPATAAGAQDATELQKLRQAIGWICDAADAGYSEDSENKYIHDIFNIAAKACGLTRRLPDEYVRFPE